MFAVFVIPLTAAVALLIVPYVKYDTDLEGAWFLSLKGRRMGAIATLTALVVIPLWIVLDEYVLDTTAWLPGVPPAIRSGLLPFTVMMAGLVGSWSADPVLLLVAISAIYLVLGMFLDPLGILLLTLPIVQPMFDTLGLDPIWLGVIVVKYIEIGLLTPPVGFKAYVVKSAVGDAVPLATIFRGIGWFLACEVVIMALILTFPPSNISLVAK